MARIDRTETADDTAASLRAVGAELRRIRLRAGLSLRDLGRLAGLTPGFLSLVERGECSLSLTSLFALSKALDVPAADLIQGSLNAEERPHFAFWPGLRERPAEVTIGEREYWRLHATFPGRQLEPLFMRILPMSRAAPLAAHEGEGFVYILSGTLSITLRDQELSLQPGSALHFRSDTPHTIDNSTREPVEALWVVTADSWEHRSNRDRD
jgi:transcriptional regulator with XRE-family HTH domain